MLEAREVCWGATGRNGGNCFPTAYDNPGDPRIGHFGLANLRAIEALIQKLDIDCEYQPQLAVRAFYTEADLEAFKRSLQILGENDAELAALTSWTTNINELVSLRVPKAIGAAISRTGARIWAYKFVAGLSEELVVPPKGLQQDNSLNLQTNTPVISLSRADDHDYSRIQGRMAWTLTTPRGAINAHQVILATNGYISALLPELSTLIVPCRGQVAALVPPDEMAGEKRIASNYLFTSQGVDDYLTQREDKGQESIIFGGGCETCGLGSTDDSIIDAEITKYLRQKLYRHLDLSRDQDMSEHEMNMTHQWSGIMGNSCDNLPWVGPVPSRPNILIAAGYTGNGMPNAFLCGQAVAVMAQAHNVEHKPETIAQTAVVDAKLGLPQSYLITQERIKKHKFANGGIKTCI